MHLGTATVAEDSESTESLPPGIGLHLLKYSKL